MPRSRAFELGNRCLTGMMLACSFSATVLAQPYPSRMVTVIVPSGPGGASDIVARIVAKELTNETKQPFVVVNQPGTSNVPLRSVLTAPPDGYVTYMSTATSSLATIQVFVKDLPFDTVKDLAPISLIGNADSVLVVPTALPVKTVADLVQLAKAKPGSLNYAATNTGSTGQMTMELFKLLAKVNIVGVNYKQAGQILPDLTSGRIDAWITPIPVVMSTINSGKVRALGTTGTVRSQFFNGVPTIAETPELRDYEVLTAYALFTRAGVSRPVIDRLNSLIRGVVALPAVKDQLAKQGVESMASEPEVVRELLIRYIAKWSAVVKAAGIATD